MKELLTAFVGKTLNIPTEEVATLLFETVDGTEVITANALDSLLEKDKGRIQKFIDERKIQFDNGYKKAQSESLSKFEKDIKEKFGITDDKQGLDLIESVISAKVKNEGGELDDEKIKRSSVYLSMLDKLTKDKTDAVKAETDKFNELQTSLQKEATFKTIAEQAMSVIKELNPILPEGKTTEGKSKADIQIQRLLKELGSEYGFEIKDGKTLVTKDGKILEDAHGNMIPFNEIVKSRASEVWDFKQGEQRQGTGNNNDNASGVNGNKAYTGHTPKSTQEYNKLIADAKDDDARIEITRVWNAEQPKL